MYSLSGQCVWSFTADASHLQNDVAKRAAEVEQFKREQAAHKMRLVQHAYDVLTNPELYKKLPDFTFMKDKIPDILSYIASHDSSKILFSEDNKIVANLATLNGTRISDLPEGDIKKVEGLKAIKNITSIDTAVETIEAAERFKDPTQREKIVQLLTMLDKNEVTVSRAKEMGGKVKSATEYIATATTITEDEKKGLLKVGKVLEEKEFAYSAKTKSIVEVDYKNFDKLVGDFYQEKKLGTYKPNTKVREYLKQANELFSTKSYRRSAQIKYLKEMGKSVGKASGLYTILTTTYTASQFAVDTSRLNLANLSANLTGSSETYFCSGIICNSFFVECRKKLKAERPILTQEELLSLDWDSCQDYFFSLSLEEQSKYAESSEVLNYLTREKGIPVIQDLSCEDSKGLEIKDENAKGEKTTRYIFNKRKIKFKTKYFDFETQKNQDSVQILQLDADKNKFKKETLRCLTSEAYPDENYELSLFTNDNNYSTIRCANKNNCNSLSSAISTATGLGLYQSKRILKLLNLQNKNIEQCCDSQKCKQFFADKKIKSKPNLANTEAPHTQRTK